MKAKQFFYCKKCAIITSVIIAGAITYLIVNHRRKQKMIQQINDVLDGKITQAQAIAGQTGSDVTPVAGLPTLSFPLKLGDKGQQVLEIQQSMNRKYGLSLKTDGALGEDTLKAMCKYYFSSCSSYVPLQWTLYTVSAEDYNTIVNKSSFMV